VDGGQCLLILSITLNKKPGYMGTNTFRKYSSPWHRVVSVEPPAVVGRGIWRVAKGRSHPSKSHSKVQHAVTELGLCFEVILHAEGSWKALWEARAITAFLNSVL